MGTRWRRCSRQAATGSSASTRGGSVGRRPRTSTSRDARTCWPYSIRSASGRAALVGNSLGGRLAYDTAIESPERVVAVVGVAAGLGGFDGGAEPHELPIIEAYEAVDAAVPFDADALTEFETRVWMDGPGQSTERVDPASGRPLREMNGPLNEADHVRGHEIKLDPPANDRLADLRCPVLAIAGRLDFSEVVRTAERLEAAAPNARVLIWDDVAHMIGMEQPARLAATVIEFLAPLDRWD